MGQFSLTAYLARLLSRLPDIHHQARILAVSFPHSSDWLHALPISSCVLRLDDAPVRLAVGLFLGAKLCECPCSAKVLPEGTHDLVCQQNNTPSSPEWSRVVTPTYLQWRSRQVRRTDADSLAGWIMYDLGCHVQQHLGRVHHPQEVPLRSKPTNSSADCWRILGLMNSKDVVFLN